MACRCAGKVGDVLGEGVKKKEPVGAVRACMAWSGVSLARCSREVENDVRGSPCTWEQRLDWSSTGRGLYIIEGSDCTLQGVASAGDSRGKLKEGTCQRLRPTLA